MKPVVGDVVEVAAEVDTDWVITQVGAPVSILEAAELFDEPVTEEGARDFLGRPGHVMFLARANDNTPIGFVTGVEMRHPDKQPEIFVYELGVDDDAGAAGEWRTPCSPLWKPSPTSPGAPACGPRPSRTTPRRSRPIAPGEPTSIRTLLSRPGKTRPQSGEPDPTGVG